MAGREVVAAPVDDEPDCDVPANMSAPDVDGGRPSAGMPFSSLQNKPEAITKKSGLTLLIA